MPPEPDSKTTKFTFPIIKSGSRMIVPISGAFGALNSQGQVVVHFFIEYPEMPEFATSVIENDSGKTLESGLSIKNPENVTREVVATFAIPIQIAGSLAKFLQDKVEQFLVANKVIVPKEEAPK